MYTFIMSVILLLVGYAVYGKIVENNFDVDNLRLTPSQRMNDGVDYIEMSWPRAFLIQFLNIAGTGPIFGAVAGALWGPAAFLWIVFGSIFGGAVHDYLSGMISLRHDGASVTEIIGEYLGENVRKVVTIFSLMLLVLVGAVFITSPALILTDVTGIGKNIWVGIIIAYYLIATVLPVDKVIGKIYPIFGASLLVMAVGIFGGMIFTGKIAAIPEFNFTNLHPKAVPIFPFLFISIACGAISGFHSTQSPMMARCIKTEKDGFRVFYGSMIMEGLVALIWAAIAMCFFPGGITGLAGAGAAGVVVNKVSMGMLGKVGGILALLGVVACPITTGDTAFRSARLIVGDFLKFNQGPVKNRFIVAVPLFVLAVGLTFVDFTIIWRYFAWANQTLAIFPLWVGANYLYKREKAYLIAMIPAMFMTTVTTTYILQAKEGFGIPTNIALLMGILITVGATAVFYKKNMAYRAAQEA
ncbi:MAG: carbon starvation CstA family protein [Fusobacteriaceae bacterium]